MTRLLGRRGGTPRLSVVVPLYNVEAYVSDCLESLVAQTYSDLEVIIVDDGSTDGSTAIANRYAESHQHWRMVRTANRGLGAARNRGAAEAHGEYIAFLDSDDLLPAYAYELMVSTLDESGSDFVVGSAEQLVDGERSELGFIRLAHRERRLGIKVEDLPEVTRNVFAWTKVFRRSFYERIDLTFPEGVKYEDQPACMKAYLLSQGFDVVKRPVYVWRIRSDGSSITQRRHELVDLRDRLTTKQMTTDVVTELGSPEVLDYWARNGLAGDLPVYFREILGADDDYWEVLHTGVRELFAGLPPIHESRLRVPQRLVGWLVTEERRSDAETVLAWLEQHPGPLPLRVDGDHVVAGLPFADEPGSGIPAETFWLGAHELEFDARLQNAHWDGTTLVLRGLALIRGAPTTGVTCRITAVLRSTTGETIPLAVVQRTSPEATAWVSRPPQRYDDCGFDARADLADAIRPSSNAAAASTWSVEITVEVAELVRSGGFRIKDPEVELSPNESDEPGRLAFKPGEGLFVTLAV